ncbi:hypothetical protein [Thiomicrorhabdus sp.]|uniref:hypothetical protein n=1 Tax=Thiomicrorhabdus sp. TaxID=2039724 RepID=UPI003566693B
MMLEACCHQESQFFKIEYSQDYHYYKFIKLVLKTPFFIIDFPEGETPGSGTIMATTSNKLLALGIDNPRKEGVSIAIFIPAHEGKNWMASSVCEILLSHRNNQPMYLFKLNNGEDYWDETCNVRLSDIKEDEPLYVNEKFTDYAVQIVVAARQIT